MPANISLFSGYNQAENRTTNYCLLALKLLYEENPKFLTEALNTLLEEDGICNVGVNFKQQQRTGKSAPDGVISQDAFTIYIETKNFDWFHVDQLERHLDTLSKEIGTKILIALSNFESLDADRFCDIKASCESKSVKFASKGFEEFWNAISTVEHISKNLVEMLADFHDYLDSENLLPTWKDRLDVIPCGALPDDILLGMAYICPATGGSYSHQRCKYFGMYRNKKVESIAEIEAVVEIELRGKSTVRWKNLEVPDEHLIEVATSKFKKLRPEEDFTAHVFLLGNLKPTNFIKDSAGGSRGKKYFDTSKLHVTNAEELANILKDKKWPDSWILEESNLL